MGARILNGVSTATYGPPMRSGAMNHGILVTFTLGAGGSISVLTFNVQGRISGGPWVNLVCTDTNTLNTLSGGELAAAAAYRFFKEQPVDDVRVNLVTLTQVAGTPANMVFADYKSEKN
jgi:hypothetical protein